MADSGAIALVRPAGAQTPQISPTPRTSRIGMCGIGQYDRLLQATLTGA
ncbi:hypothetical protein QUA82_20075 [Microcoleus sp. F8-D3]